MCSYPSITDVISCVFSFLAIIVSIIAIVMSNSVEKKVMKISINEKYYSKVFDDYLLYKIPDSRDKLEFIDGKLLGTNEFGMLIDGMVRAAGYFKYQNEVFFKMFYEMASYLEDYLTECSKKKIIDKDEQAQVHREIKEKIECIYKCIETYKYK